MKIPHEIWILVYAAFIIALGFGLVAPLIPQVALSFGVGMAAAGAVISVFSGTRLLFAPMSGRLIDALGSRKIYLTGLITVGLTTGAIALAQEYWHIIVLRAMSGFGSTMFTVSAMSLVVRLAPPEIRGRASSAYSSGFLLGSIFGPILGSFLSVLGMRWPFVIYAAALLLASWVVWARMPKHVGRPEGRNSEDRTPMTFREAVRDSAYLSSLFGAFANGWCNFGVRIAVVPLFAAAAFANGAAIAGFVMTAFAIGNATALQFSGKLADRIGRKPLIISGLIINGIFTATFGLTTEFWILLVLSAAAGFGAGTLNPAQQAVLADVVGPERSGGKVLANFQMAQDLGSIVGPIAIGAVAQAIGFEIAFAISGAICLIAAVIWFFGRESLPHAPN